MSDSVRQQTFATIAGLIAVGSLYVSEPVSPAVAAAALGGLIIISSWQPIVIIGLTAAALPLYHQPFEAGDTVLAPSELMLAALVVGTLVRVTGAGPIDRETKSTRGADFLAGLDRLNTPFGRIAIGALGLISVIGFALLTQVDEPTARSAGLRELRWTFVEPLIFVGLLLWHAKTARDRLFIVGAFVTGGLLIAIWGLVDAVSGGGVSAGGVTRAEGPFPHPNAYALYLLRPLALSAAYLIVTRNRSVPPWVACGIGAAALVASFSRSAALGLVAGFIVLWPWLSPRLRLLTASGAAIFAAALTIVARDRVIGGSGQDSLALRGDIWRSGLTMIRDRPIIGYGPDQFLYTYSPRYVNPAGWAERFTSHGHNLIIDAWVRIGIIGAVCVVLALVFISRAAYQVGSGANQAPGDALRSAAVVALVAAGVQGLVDNGYFVHDLAMSAWLLAWVAFAPPQHQRGALLHEGSRDRGSRPGRIPPL